MADNTATRNRASYTGQSAKVTYTARHGTHVGATASSPRAAALLGRPADLRADRPRQVPADRQARCRASTSRPKSTAARNTASTSGSRTWCSRRSSTARRSAARSRATPAKPRGALAVVPCTASDTRGKVIAGTINAVAVVATNTWLRDAAGQLAVGEVDAAGVDRATSTARRSWRTAQGLMASGAALVAEPVRRRRRRRRTLRRSTVVAARSARRPSKRPTRCPTSRTRRWKCSTAPSGSPTTRRRADGCEIWAPTQAAGSVATTAATLTACPPASHRAHDVPRRRARPQDRAGLHQPGDPGRDGGRSGR